MSQGPLNRGGGGFKRGGLPDLDSSVPICPSLFVLFCPFLSFFVLLIGIFPICPSCTSLGLLTAPERKSPEKVRDTIRTFPEKSGKPPGLETPRFSFSQVRSQNLSPPSATVDAEKDDTYQKIGGGINFLRGPHMGGQIRRGRIWRFWGAPLFSPEVPKYLLLKGFGTSGLKSGAPQKRQILPRRI